MTKTQRWGLGVMLWAIYLRFTSTGEWATWVAAVLLILGLIWLNRDVQDDARLIAAAPDLLSACELALEWLDEVCNPEAVDWLVDQDGVAARRQIEAAITKAKGE